jgi:hypothetical protein
MTSIYHKRKYTAIMDELTKKQLARNLFVQSLDLGKRLPSQNKAEENNKSNNLDCRKCVHFFVTWEKNCPYGCKAYGFKGPQIPSIVVKSSSGESCRFFKQRS